MCFVNDLYVGIFSLDRNSVNYDDFTSENQMRYFNWAL